jgi:hypothetical protein
MGRTEIKHRRPVTLSQLTRPVVRRRPMISPQSQRAPQRQRTDRFGATDRTQRARSPRAGPNAFPLARLAHHDSGSTRASRSGKQPLDVRRRQPTPRRASACPPATRRCALELLVSCRDGCTEAIMLAHGFTIEQMKLVRAGLVTVTAERVVAGGRKLEVATLRITEAGQRAIAERAPAAVSAPANTQQTHECGR